MALTNFAEIFSPVLLQALRDRLVYSRFFNNDYQGNVTYGNKVAIVNLDAVTVGPYTRDTAIDYELASDTKQSLLIDQQQYFAVSVDDIDAVQSNANILGGLAADGAFQLAKTMDTFLAGVVSAGAGIVSGLGTSGAPLAITSADVKALLLTIGRKLDEANVPRQGRAVAVPPWFLEKIVLAGITDSTANQDMLLNGSAGRFLGFDVLVSNSVPVDTAKFQIVAGTNLGATMAMQLAKTEQIRLESHFADAIRGLAVYGGKVTRAGTIAKAWVTEGPEA